MHLVQAAQFAVLARDVALAHRGDLEPEVEIGKVEVGRDRLAHAPLSSRLSTNVRGSYSQRMPRASSARAHSTSASWAKRVTASQARDVVGRRPPRGRCDSIPAMVHGGRTNGMLRTLLVSLVGLLAVPARAFAADDSGSSGGGYTDNTTKVMLGIIFILMIAMVLIGVLEGRGKH